MLQAGQRWKVRYGLKTKFWVDKWLGDETIIQNCRQPVVEEDIQNKVGGALDLNSKLSMKNFPRKK